MKKTVIILVIAVLVILAVILGFSFNNKDKGEKGIKNDEKIITSDIKYNGLEFKNIKIQRDNEKTVITGEIINDTVNDITLDDEITLLFLDAQKNIVNYYAYYVGKVEKSSSKKLQMVVFSVLDTVTEINIK